MCVTYIFKLTSSLKIYVCNICLKDIRSNDTSVGNIYMRNVYTYDNTELYICVIYIKMTIRNYIYV